MPQREAALREGEAALAAGRTGEAEAAFERAASMLHAADTEMGQVRAAMQAGQYRRALAFGAHTAGGHVDSPQAAVLYAWLLRAGGQGGVADRVLADALGRAPLDGVARAAAAAFASALPLASGALLETPQRTAPYPWSPLGTEPPPQTAGLVGTGVLIDGGRRALVPAALLNPGTARLWLRNGMGQAVAAQRDASGGSAALAVFRLEAALPFLPGDEAERRLPFAGSPTSIAEYAAGARAVPAWPWLRQGFLGTLGRDGERRLGIDAASGLLGGTVLDRAGRVVGVALPGDGFANWLPAATGAEGRDPAAVPGAPARSLPVPPAPLDETYERVLRVTLQVICERAESSQSPREAPSTRAGRPAPAPWPCAAEGRRPDESPG